MSLPRLFENVMTDMLSSLVASTSDASNSEQKQSTMLVDMTGLYRRSERYAAELDDYGVAQ
jgi:hypothetical protein